MSRCESRAATKPAPRRARYHGSGRRDGLSVGTPRQVPRLVADPGEIGTAPQAGFLALPNPARLFNVRARRLRALAAGNPFAAFLDFMAAVADAQDASLAQARPLPPGRGGGFHQGWAVA